VTETMAFGVARPSAIERAGPLATLLGEFIDCRWPGRYLSPPKTASSSTPQGSRTMPGPP
jgi:hypothetical protein